MQLVRMDLDVERVELPPPLWRVPGLTDAPSDDWIEHILAAFLEKKWESVDASNGLLSSPPSPPIERKRIFRRSRDPTASPPHTTNSGSEASFGHTFADFVDDEAAEVSDEEEDEEEDEGEDDERMEEFIRAEWV